MKKLIFICLLFNFAHAKELNNSTLFQKLTIINRCWIGQQEVTNLAALHHSIFITNELDMIQTHLALVEQILRNRNTDNLSNDQKAARLQNLDHLHEYWLTNKYPVNNKTAFRNPVFIDDYNTFCAVGYLIKTSGHESLSRMIAANTNLAYLREMKYEALDKWVQQSGLTLDELAWIQPGYIAANHSRGVSGGVNGPVYAITGQEELGRLYVAGSFTMADMTVPCSNIMVVQYQKDIYANTFTALGPGLNGEVRALYADENALYAGGHFDHSGTTPANNIARWIGNLWESMGTLTGTVYTIAKYKNKIYAGGDFTFTVGPNTYSNLAIWSGSEWLPVCNSINGAVYAMKVHDSYLVIGGSFTTVDNVPTNHIFRHDGMANTTLGDGVNGTVRALSTTGPSNLTLLIGGDLTSDTFGIAEYSSQWGWSFQYKELVRQAGNYAGRIDKVYAMTGNTIGGIMTTSGMTVSMGTGKYDIDDGHLSSFATFDSTVYAMYKTGTKTFFGGAFKKSINGGGGVGGGGIYEANYLAVWDESLTGINEQIVANHFSSIAPNPLTATSEISSDRALSSCTVFDLNGRLVFKKETTGSSIQLDRSVFPANGLYLIHTIDESGNREIHKLAVN